MLARVVADDDDRQPGHRAAIRSMPLERVCRRAVPGIAGQHRRRRARAVQMPRTGLSRKRRSAAAVPAISPALDVLGGAAVDLARDRRVEHDDRNTRGEGLERRQAEALVLREERKHRGARVERPRALRRRRSCAVRPARRRRGSPRLPPGPARGQRAVGADDHQPRRREVGRRPRKRRDQIRQPPPVEERPDVQHQRLARRSRVGQSRDSAVVPVTPGGITRTRSPATWSLRLQLASRELRVGEDDRRGRRGSCGEDLAPRSVRAGGTTRGGR